MAELYALSHYLVERMPAAFDRTEAHDPGDAESADRLWIAGTERSDLCDGEYISVSPLTDDSWYVCLNSADKAGGHPTNWSMSGTESDVLRDVTRHIESELE